MANGSGAGLALAAAGFDAPGGGATGVTVAAAAGVVATRAAGLQDESPNAVLCGATLSSTGVTGAVGNCGA